MRLEARIRKLEDAVELTPTGDCGYCAAPGGVVLLSEWDAVQAGRCPRCGGSIKAGFGVVLLPDLEPTEAL